VTQLTFISLFAGIGGLDLGLERAGLRCVAQVEIDPYATQVLAKHWPDVARYGDIRGVGAHNLPAADCLVGGFPCQDISEAGKRAGLAGARSGLWYEYARLIGELRPRYILVENVSDLLDRGMGVVLGTLAELGYDAEWEVFPASAFGLPHIRERVFLLAYPVSELGISESLIGRQFAAARLETPSRQSCRGNGAAFWLQALTALCRDDDGVPARVDRLKGLGNAVVPQVAEYIGRCLVAFDAQQNEGAA
jgi:DNA (cytosine-5)-methyltransferase 1